MGEPRRGALRSLFRVRPGETEPVLLMLALSIFSVGGIVITGQLVGRSLFLSALPTSAIPLKFIVPPLALVVVVSLYTRLANRGRHVRLQRATLTLSLVGVVLCRLALATAARESLTFLLGLFVFFEILAALSMIQFWTLAGDLFHPRQARRLFGLISGGSAISNVLFGAFLVRLAREVRPEDLLLVIAASIACSAWIVGRVSRLLPGSAAAPSAPVSGREAPGVAGGWTRDLREVLGSPFTRVLCGIVIVIALASNIADYQLDLALKASYGDNGQGMVGFLALFRLWAGVVAIAVQFVVAGWVMERFGVVPALLMLPAAVSLGATATLLTGGALWAVAIPRASDVVLKYTVHDSAFHLLYLPLPPAMRSRAKSVIDGVLKPPLVALLGVGFLLVSRFEISFVAWAGPLLALTAVWAAMTLSASRHYVQALARSISMRRLDLASETIDFADDTTAGILRRGLGEADSLRVIHTLELVREGGDEWVERVVPVLKDPSADVRAAALRYLGERGNRRYLEAVRPSLDDPAAQVRESAIEACCRLAGGEALPEIRDCLEDPDPRIAHVAIVALIRHGGLAGFLHAGRSLHLLLESEEASGRGQAAAILGELAVSSFHGPLGELVRDSDADVRAVAVRAAGRLATPELVPVLREALDEPGLRESAMRAMLACAGEDLTALGELLGDDTVPLEVRTRLPARLAEHGVRGVRMLVADLADPDPRVRAAVYLALHDLRETGHRLDVPDAELDRRLDEELQLGFDALLRREDLRAVVARHELLREALDLRLAGDRARVIALLLLRYPALRGAHLREALDGNDVRLGSNALELLDHTVTAGKAAVVAFLGGPAECLDAARRRPGLASRSEAIRMAGLVADPDPWLQACAIDAIGQAGSSDLAEVVESVRNARNDLVRETASRAAERLHRDRKTRPSVEDGGAARGESETMGLGSLEKILFLRQVPLFGEIPGEEIATVLPIVHEVSFEAGQTVIEQGDEGQSLYIIVEGEIEVLIDGQRVGDLLRSRAVLGELAILTGDARAATCRTVGEVLALRIERDDFWGLLRERNEVALGVIKILTRYLKR